MSNILQKLIKNNNTSLPRVLLNSVNLHQIPFLQKPTSSYLIPNHRTPGIPEPSRIDQSPKLSQPQQLNIFPNSPIGFCVNPVPLSGVRVSEEAVDDDLGVVRADSVKKKRKKKMNKHKYKKLRKRLRRKAK